MEVDIQDGQVILREVKLALVTSKAQFIEALKEGKRWCRRQSMKARLESATTDVTG